MIPRALLLLLCLAAPCAAGLRVQVVTIGPGELPWERFGHNALIVRGDDGRGVAFDWGRFDFEQPGFLTRFARGEMLYSSGAADADALLDAYVRLGRGVTVQDLNLTPAQAAAALAYCERAYLPDQREYVYDYYTANCSTKLRDALDAALGGALKERWQGAATGTTYRRETERHLAPDPAMWFAVHAAAGPSTEVPIDCWQHAFVPAVLADLLDAGGLATRRVELQADPIGVPAAPPTRWPATGVIGLGVAFLTLLPVAFGRLWPARLLAAGWSLFAGLLGLIGVGLWALTDHDAGYANQTVLLVSPVGLAVALLTLVPRWRRAAAWAAGVQLVLCGLGTLLFLTPVGQHNAAVVTLALPATAAAWWVASRAGRVVSPACDAA